MIYRIEYADRAEEDILRNASWWAEHHSLDQALEFDDVVREQIATLSEMPERFGFAYENDRFDIEIRQMLVGRCSVSQIALKTIQACFFERWTFAASM